MGDHDIFRDSLLRYMGYSNEVGEAFRPLISKSLVNLSYGLAISYVLADAYDKTSTVYKRTRTDKTKAALIQGGDVLIWQMLASVIIPGFTINRITWASGKTLRYLKLRNPIFRFVPTALGLCSIPFIIKPIDNLVDNLMNKTYREYVGK